MTRVLTTIPCPHPHACDRPSPAGASGLIPVGVEALAPAIASAVGSIGGGGGAAAAPLTANQTARLLHAAGAASVALIDGDFGGVLATVAQVRPSGQRPY